MSRAEAAHLLAALVRRIGRCRQAGERADIRLSVVRGGHGRVASQGEGESESNTSDVCTLNIRWSASTYLSL